MNHESYRKLQENLELISLRLALPHNKRMEQMIEKINSFQKRSQLVFEQFTNLTKVPELGIASSSLASALKTIQLDTSMLTSFTTAHESYVNNLIPISEQIQEAQRSIVIALAKSSDLLALAGSIKSQIDFTGLHATLGIDQEFISCIIESQTVTENSYSKLVQSLVKMPELIKVPPIVLPSASREIFISEYAIGTLASRDTELDEDYIEESVDGVREETSDVGLLLSYVHSDLAKTHQGAYDAFQHHNTDYERHVLSSLRELWTHLLHMLALEPEVLLWIDGNPKYIHDGKPTRKARYHFICRKVHWEPFSNFFIQNTKAFLEMFAFFQKVHALRSGLSDRQLRTLMIRSDSFLKFVLEIHGASH